MTGTRTGIHVGSSKTASRSCQRRYARIDALRLMTKFSRSGMPSATVMIGPLLFASPFLPAAHAASSISSHSPVGIAHRRLVTSTGGAVYRNRPIVYLTTATQSDPVATDPSAGPDAPFLRAPIHRTVWHVAWCRPNMGVRLGTELVPPQHREPGYAAHWVYENVLRKQIRVAMNGAVFNESVFPAVPIAGVGQGRGHWTTGSDATSAKYCIGFGAILRHLTVHTPEIKTAAMVYAYSRAGTGPNAGRMVPFYTVDPAVSRDYPYGFGCVGLIAQDGRFNETPAAGGWENAQSLSPDMPRARTMLAWTRSGDMFFIAADARSQRHGPGSVLQSDGATWADAVRFLRQTLPDDTSARYYRCLSRRRPIRIEGAVMLDGGVSTEFGYERIDRRGWINLDRYAPHGGEGIPRAYIPSIVYAIAPDHVSGHRRRRSHRRRHNKTPMASLNGIRDRRNCT